MTINKNDFMFDNGYNRGVRDTENLVKEAINNFKIIKKKNETSYGKGYREGTNSFLLLLMKQISK